MGKGIKEDLIGMKFGKLVALERVVKNKKTYYICQCDCGNKTKKLCRSDNLKEGITTHCGCNLHYGKHGMTNTRLFNIWSGMRNRCLSKNGKDYTNYGGRGIKICNEWLDDFMNFYNWAINNGYSDELTIDRKDVNGNYDPNNCRWATHLEQSNNTRINNLIEINGEIKSVSEWSRISGVSRKTIVDRFTSGLRGEFILEVPQKAEFQSGVKGVKWDKYKKRWKSEIKEDGRIKHIGYFVELDDAIKAKEEYISNQIKEA